MNTLDWLFWTAGGLLAAGGVALLAWALLWDRARGRTRCPKCWYDMAGAAALASDIRTREPRLFRCPECGRTATTERRLRRTRRRWGWAVAAAALLLLARGVFVGQSVAGGWKDRKLNALPHSLVKLALWASSAWDGSGTPASPSYAGAPGTNLAWALAQSRGGKTIAEQWNDLLAAYRLGEAIRRTPAADWDSGVTTRPGSHGSRRSVAPPVDVHFAELSNLGDEGWPAVAVLIDAIEGRLPANGVKSQRALARSNALLALTSIGPEAAAAIPALERLALGHDPLESPGIIDVIVAISPDPGASLAGLLGAEPDWVAICALDALRAMGTKGAGAAKAVGRLARTGRTSTLRGYAVVTLKSIAPREPGAVRDLAASLHDLDPSVQIPVARTLGYWSPEARPAVPDLCALARNTTDDGVRLTAAWAVSALAPASPEAVDLAARIAECDDLPARIWALRTLASWGRDASAAADRIRPLLSDDSEYVRVCTAAALEAMADEHAAARPVPGEFSPPPNEDRQ